MRIIIAGVPQEMADSYALRMIEQGKAIPAPTAPKPRAAAKAEQPRAKERQKGGMAHVAKEQD